MILSYSAYSWRPLPSCHLRSMRSAGGGGVAADADAGKVLRKTLLALGFVALILLNLGCSSEKATERNIALTPAIVVKAVDLRQAYEDNEIAADDKYKNKVLIVQGIVENIGKDILDTPYVTLATDNALGSVQCMFADDHKGELAELQKGQAISIKGRCGGKALLNVLLRGCCIGCELKI
jgi:hypothetical protein